MKESEMKTETRYMRAFSIPQDDGAFYILNIAHPMTASDFDTLINTLNLWKKNLVERVVEGNGDASEAAGIAQRV